MRMALARVLQGALVRLIRSTGPRLLKIGPGETGVGAGVVGIELDRLLVKAAGGEVVLGRESEPQLAPTQNQVVGLEVAGPLARAPGAAPFGGVEFSGERGDDLARDLVLNGEDVLERAVVAFGPQVMPGRRLDELSGNAYLVSRLANAALEDVAHPQFAAHVLHPHRFSLVGEHRVAAMTINS